jgi:hypothetical protein
MKCLVCQNYLIEFLNLGKLPPSDYFAASKFAAKNTPLYKLSVGRCKKCHLIQKIYT